MADSNIEYMKLITSEYSLQPMFNSYVEAFLNQLSPVNNCYESFNILFNIESAVGDQLDKLGELVGISRSLPTSDPDIPAVLDDDTFRRVIAAKILQNHWDGTLKGLESIFHAFYKDLPYEVVDNQDMSYNVLLIDPSITKTEIALIEGGFIAPKPSGVKVNYQVLDSTLFGWDSSTNFIDGWDKGRWVV